MHGNSSRGPLRGDNFTVFKSRFGSCDNGCHNGNLGTLIFSLLLYSDNHNAVHSVSKGILGIFLTSSKHESCGDDVDDDIDEDEFSQNFAKILDRL